MLTAGTPRGRPIVVGVHGTAASDAAVDWAAGEARLRLSPLHLVLARDPASRCRAPYAPAPVPAAADACPSFLLAKAVRRALRLLPPGWVSSELADGLPGRVLLDRAVGAGLLVLGATRPAGHPAGILGPVARACMRHPPCPLVIVARDTSQAAVPRPRLPDGRAVRCGQAAHTASRNRSTAVITSPSTAADRAS
jgi:nucleotide-binding universal stress UspA family protein